MSEGRSPTVRRRRLAFELRRLREGANISPDAVIQELEFSRSKLSRIEAGRSGVSANDLRAMCQLYGVNGAVLTGLLELARESRKHGWWQVYADSMPSWLQSYVGLELEAASLSNYEAELVPGLLQTERYVRALHEEAIGEKCGEEVERRVKIRLARQAVLSEDDPPRFGAVLNEAVLHRAVGCPEIMLDQLSHLVEMSQRDNVDIQILPFKAGAHPAMSGSFMLIGFDEATDADIVCLDNQTSCLFIEKEDEIERYRLAFNRLRAKALDSTASMTLIRRVAKEL